MALRWTLVCFVLFFSSFCIARFAPEGVAGCYKNTTTRGVGKPVSVCPDGKEEDAGLCYVPCKQGFNGVGPVCWEICPDGYTDTGAFCEPKVIAGDNSKCPPYDKCGLVSAKGCVKCPANFSASGCLCVHAGHTFAKQSYGRGVGTPLVCAKGLVYDAGLCYPPCPSGGYNGIGPVCWFQCRKPYSYDCGAICVADSSTCAGTVKEIADTLLDLIFELANCFDIAGCDPAAIEKTIKQLIDELAIPICAATLKLH